MGPRNENDVPFREHLAEQLSSMQKLEDERWVAHHREHDMGQRAIDARFLANDAKLVTMNEFREQQTRERADFVRQEVYNSEYKSLEDKVAMQAEWINNMNGRLWAAGVVILGLSTVIGFLFRLWGR